MAVTAPVIVDDRPRLEDEDPIMRRLDAWAARHAKAAPRLGEEQLEILRDLFQ
ncbi:hypothetical protein ACF073_16785 [Streptomyces sp. NPDC015171]|uniref:hypothetical protein n=1 Tax=Streptomyces sp. NPDC015171 TaxID=3364945 RepID=UPI0036FEC830